MKRLIIILFLSISGISLINAQISEAPSKPDSDYSYEPIRKGDQYIRMGLGGGFPLFNMSADGIVPKTNLVTGGTGTIGYSRYLNSNFSLGGEIAFSYNQTIGENIFFYLPITFRTTYTFVFDRIHVPLTLAGGFAFQTYNATNFFGAIIKPEIGAYFQYSPDWSYGASVGWNMLPQIYKNEEDNRTGNILDLVLAVRYHF